MEALANLSADENFQTRSLKLSLNGGPVDEWIGNASEYIKIVDEPCLIIIDVYPSMI